MSTLGLRGVGEVMRLPHYGLSWVWLFRDTRLACGSEAYGESIWGGGRRLDTNTRTSRTSEAEPGEHIGTECLVPPDWLITATVRLYALFGGQSLGQYT